MRNWLLMVPIRLLLKGVEDHMNVVMPNGLSNALAVLAADPDVVVYFHVECEMKVSRKSLKE